MAEEDFKLDLEVDDEVIQAQSPAPTLIADGSQNSKGTPSRKRQPRRNYSPDVASSHVSDEKPSTSETIKEEKDDESVVSSKRQRKTITSRFSPTPSASLTTPKSAPTRMIERFSMSELLSAVKRTTSEGDFVFPFPEMLNKKRSNRTSVAAATKNTDETANSPIARVSSTSGFIKLRMQTRTRSSRGADSVDRDTDNTNEKTSFTPPLSSKKSKISSAGLSREVVTRTRKVGTAHAAVVSSSGNSQAVVGIKKEIKEELDKEELEHKPEVILPASKETAVKPGDAEQNITSSSRRVVKHQKAESSTVLLPESNENETSLRRSARDANLTAKMKERIASGASGIIVGDKPKVDAKPNSALAIQQKLQNRKSQQRRKLTRSSTPDNNVTVDAAIPERNNSKAMCSESLTEPDAATSSSVHESPVVVLPPHTFDIDQLGESINTPKEEDDQPQNQDATMNEEEVKTSLDDGASSVAADDENVKGDEEGHSTSDMSAVEPFIAYSESPDGKDALALPDEYDSKPDFPELSTPKKSEEPENISTQPRPVDSPRSTAFNSTFDDAAATIVLPEAPRTGRGKGNLLAQCPSELIKKPEHPSRASSRRVARPTRFDDYVIEAVRPGPSRTDVSTEVPSKVAEEQMESPVAVTEESSLVAKRKSMEAAKEDSVKKKSKRTFCIKLKLGNDQSAQILENTGANSTSDLDTDTTANSSIESEVIAAPVELPNRQSTPKKKTASKRKPAAFYHSFKEVIPDFVRPDGTLEKLGRLINSVMDNVLEGVCEDGITRHINTMCASQKKQLNSQKASAQYWKKKGQREQYVAECLSKGIEPEPLATAKVRRSDIVASTERSERVSKGALYNEVRLALLPHKKKYDGEKGRRDTPETDPDYAQPGKRGRGGKSALSIHTVVDYAMSSDAEEDDYTREASEEQIEEDENNIEMSYERFESFLAKDGCYGLVDQYSLLPRNDLTTEHDFFYRDVLATVQSSSNNRFYNEEVDIDSVEPVNTVNHVKDMSNRGSTDNLANNIEVLMMRPASPNGSYGISELFRRGQEESELHRAILDRAVDIILDYHNAGASSTTESWNDLALVNSGYSTAVALRDLFSMYYSERKPAILWVHRFLVELLPVDFLASYMNLLKTCRTMRFLVVKKLIQETATLDDPWPAITEDILSKTKPSDSVKDAINGHLDSTVALKCLNDVAFLILAPTFEYDSVSARTSHVAPLFKWLTVMGDKNSEVWNCCEDADPTLTIAELGDSVVQNIIDKVTDLRNQNYVNRIVVVGYKTSCYFAHRAAQLTPGISAIIDISFPLITSEGPRGDPDDDILLTYCPSLFVVGADAEDFDPILMKDMRNLMISRTGLVVVAHADSHLNVLTSVLSGAGITQTHVFRMILEHIYDFLMLKETMQERAKLAPLQLNRLPFTISQAVLESASSVKVQANNSAAKPPRKALKRKADLNTSASASGVRNTEQARTRFDEIIKRARVEREALEGKHGGSDKDGFKVPMPPHPKSPSANSPLPQTPSSSSYVDPASISLG